MWKGKWLRLYDPKTGEHLRAPEETEEALREAMELVSDESKARQEAEAEIARLQAEIVMLREKK